MFDLYGIVLFVFVGVSGVIVMLFVGCVGDCGYGLVV